MDDFVLLLNDKEECKKIKKLIEEFLEVNLHLHLNKKSKFFHNRFGIDFLGYRIFDDYLLLRKNSKKKIRKKIRKWNKEYDANILDTHKAKLSINSWITHIKHCDSHRLKAKILNEIKFKY